MIVSLALNGNGLLARAQSRNVAIPTATPETKRPPKPITVDTTQPASVTGTIEGSVVSDDGRPMTNATVVVQPGLGMVVPRVTRVDNEGRFVFEDLPPAAYIISASAPGYIDQAMSQGDPNQWPRHLIGEQLKITMIKGGVITGTVTNSIGSPIVGTPVSASPVSGTSNAIQSLLGLGSGAETDDRGIYRIFGLLPGTYIVSAGGGGPFGQFRESGFDLDTPTYYPSGMRAGAVPVNVRSGDETTDIDIKYRGFQGHSISGFVTGEIESNTPLGGMTIVMSDAATASNISLAISETVNQRRVFTFNAVADGEYDLMATYASRPNENPLIGTKRVVVRGSDVTGVEIRLGLLASIAGTIVLDPIKPEDKCDKRGSELIETVITAQQDQPKKDSNPIIGQLLSQFSWTLKVKGDFILSNLEASKYRLRISLPTEAWYVRAIIPSGTTPVRGAQSVVASSRPVDAWQGVITLKSGERFGPLKIMVGQDAAALSGRVTTKPETGIPVGLQVHLVPEEPERIDNILCYSETLVNRDGSFSFSNLAPGKYFVVTRIDPTIETQPLPPRPVAWDPTARIKLRREAEAAKNVVELKPCQRLIDFTMIFQTSQ